MLILNYFPESQNCDLSTCVSLNYSCKQKLYKIQQRFEYHYRYLFLLHFKTHKLYSNLNYTPGTQKNKKVITIYLNKQ